jgi:hypothetical protein
VNGATVAEDAEDAVLRRGGDDRAACGGTLERELLVAQTLLALDGCSADADAPAAANTAEIPEFFVGFAIGTNRK